MNNQEIIKKYTEENQGILKIDMACGQRKQPGFLGIDIAPCEGVDIVYNLNEYPYDFIEDNSVDEIYCSHFIEHVGSLPNFMDELYRIIKPTGKIYFLAPYYNSVRCWQDPTHVRAISEASFQYYNKGWRDVNGLSHYGIKCDFNYTYGYNITPEWRGRSVEAQTFAVKHYMNVVEDIIVNLSPIK